MEGNKEKTDTVTKLALIARHAREDRKVQFTSLTHHLKAQYLKHCFEELKRGKAAGIDGRTWESYNKGEIERVVEETAALIQAKKYRPQPMRRVYIKKDNGKMRPLGIPTVIDKVVQLAVTRILEAIYEPNFLPVSYGYRPGKDAHEALKDINHMIMREKMNWIIDGDIEGFFDHVDHRWMRRCLDQRIRDPNFKRLIWRFLKAGVMEKGMYHQTEEGTPQGGILSPILANIYLHYVLDLWFEGREKKENRGYAHLVRYADDFVIGAQHKREAQQIVRDVEDRLRQFGLTLSQEKIRVIEFGRFAKENTKKQGRRKPETFDFLGLTHYCTKTRDGRFMVRVKTSRKRMNRSVESMKTWLKRVRNVLPVEKIWPTISSKLHGHYNYYGVSGNFESIQRYYGKTRYLVFKWLNRRSQKRTWNWDGFLKYLETYPFPKPKLTYAIYNTW